MSSNSFVDTVDLTLRPSVRALQWLFWLHVVPIALLPFALQPGPILWVMLGLFALSWIGLRRHPLFGFGPKALTRLVLHVDNPGATDYGGVWSVYGARGQQASATLLGSSYLHPRLLVLNFLLTTGERRSRAILGDEADPELLRRLRARLLLARAKSGTK